jgi:hypothetical protein
MEIFSIDADVIHYNLTLWKAVFGTIFVGGGIFV